MAGLRELMRKYREAAPTHRDMGTAFERLVKVWLENAPTQRGQYGRVLTYADWAQERGEGRKDLMRFALKSLNFDRTTVQYNPRITITGIPLEAYDYVVNGKPALEWVMKRLCVKTDGPTGIISDANRYAVETMGDPAYPLQLFRRVIAISLETMKIVRNLPSLDIREQA